MCGQESRKRDVVVVVGRGWGGGSSSEAIYGFLFWREEIPEKIVMFTFGFA